MIFVLFLFLEWRVIINIEYNNLDLEKLIFEIRGVYVMLSSDVAKIYHVETKVLNQTIKRNINRFPETFCFQLTNDELKNLSLRSQFVTLNNNNSSRSQIVTLNKSNNSRGYNIKYMPYVLTEQGIMMLSGLLKSEIAVQVNVQIIEAFCLMKKYFNDDALVLNHEKRIQKLEKVFYNYYKVVIIC